MNDYEKLRKVLEEIGICFGCGTTRNGGYYILIDDSFELIFDSSGMFEYIYH